MKFFKIKVSKRIKWLVGGLLVIIVLPYLAYQGYITYFVKPYFAPVLKQRISEYEFIEDGKAIVVKWDYDNPVDYWLTSSSTEVMGQNQRRFGQTKIVQEYKKIKGVEVRSNTPIDQEYWGITVYDTQNQTLTSKDYDIFKLVRDYGSNYFPISIGNVIYKSADKDLVDIYISDIKDSSSSIRKSIDLSSGKIVNAGSEWGRDKQEYTAFSSEVNLLPLTANYYIFDREIYVEPHSQLASSSFIWNKYPRSAEILSNKNSTLIMLGDILTLEDRLPTLQLLVGNGENIFKNIRIPAENSIDGKEHVINSLEEFKHYYNSTKVKSNIKNLDGKE